MECRRCMLSLSSFKRCTGCYQVSYCSRTCQKADWRDHRELCKAFWSEDHSRNKKKKKCDNAFIDHENEQFTKDDTGETIPGRLYSQTMFRKNTKVMKGCCAVCNKDATKNCARCKQVSYCSKKCQKLDWRNHKTVCQEQESDDEEVIFNPFLYLAHHVHQQSMMEDMLSLKFITTEEDFHQAIGLVGQLFPFRTVISSLHKVPSENMFFRPQTNDVLVAFITRFHHYRARHCVYIEDKNGEEIYVAFYFVGDVPYPFFKWSDVRPGKFIAIKSPCIHHFIDGSVGLRINDPSEVLFIELI